MVEVISRRPVTKGLKTHGDFGNWFDGRGGVYEHGNTNSDPKTIREWARTKEHLPGFKEFVSSAKAEADVAHRLNMKQKNKHLKEHEKPEWKQT